jgi:formyl-CoA transferase
MDWEHLRARDMVRPLAQPDGTPAGSAAAGFPLKFSRSEAHHDMPAPMPGTHTGEVLARFLGTGADEIEKLRRDGIV